MSSDINSEEVKHKLTDGTYNLFAKDSSSNKLWTYFQGICSSASDVASTSAGDGKPTELPFVSCNRCKKLLSYDKIKGGTSHLRRHADICNAKSVASSSTPSISNFFKSCTLPLSAKQNITEKCAEFACVDIRPFEVVAGNGFKAMAQAFIDIGVKYGQVSASDVIPHPTTVSRKISDIATNLKDTEVMPELNRTLNRWGGGLTTDMWTECYNQTSYITVTCHYITDDWCLVERVLSTREFDPELRHTGVNIKDAIDVILKDFKVETNKVVCVTDRGANVLAAMKDSKHISCCDHMINTVLTHMFDSKSHAECPAVQGLLTASKELVRFFKKGGLMRLLPTALKQEVCTRWSSIYMLLDSVLKNYDQVEHILQTKNELYRMAGIEKTLLEQLVSFLEVFKSATLELEATATPTLQLALPWFYKMKQHCQAAHNDCAEIAILKVKATELIDSKFVLAPLHYIATVLNPKMKTLKMFDETSRKYQVYEALRTMVSSITLPEITEEHIQPTGM